MVSVMVTTVICRAGMNCCAASTDVLIRHVEQVALVAAQVEIAAVAVVHA
jgi:hypothetical protein